MTLGDILLGAYVNSLLDDECRVYRGACGSWSHQKYNPAYSVEVSKLELDYPEKFESALEFLTSHSKEGKGMTINAQAVSVTASIVDPHTGMVTPETKTFDPNYQLPLMGPMGDEYREVWGFDVHYLKARTYPGVAAEDASEAIRGDSSWDSLIVSNPRHVYELMSHCTAGVSVDRTLLSFDGAQARWLGKDTHERIIDFMRKSRVVPCVDVLCGGGFVDYVCNNLATPFDVYVNYQFSRTEYLDEFVYSDEGDQLSGFCADSKSSDLDVVPVMCGVVSAYDRSASIGTGGKLASICEYPAFVGADELFVMCEVVSDAQSDSTHKNVDGVFLEVLDSFCGYNFEQH